MILKDVELFSNPRKIFMKKTKVAIIFSKIMPQTLIFVLKQKPSKKTSLPISVLLVTLQIKTSKSIPINDKYLLKEGPKSQVKQIYPKCILRKIITCSFHLFKSSLH